MNDSLQRLPGRLPVGVRPLRYDLHLTIDPDRERFSGTLEIPVVVDQETDRIHLHARNLDLGLVQLRLPDGTEREGTAAPAAGPGSEPEEGEVAVDFGRPVPAGEAILLFEFRGPFDRQMSGLYRVKDGDAWYAFTQFEAADARKCFPCFDEPGFKVPFRVRLTVPEGMPAFANNPEESRETDGGRTTVTYAETPPLPTYLVAFAVGPFDVVPWDGEGTVPIRAIAPRGKGGQTGMALRFTAELLAELERYFGIPYPYAKLDVVAVPEFGAGAMENAGLITFREEALLGDESTVPVSRRRSVANIICHEIAHHWFGNLVTMDWWDDLWLNEAFATWIAAKIVDVWNPDYRQMLDLLEGRRGPMTTDSLRAARKIRQPVETVGDAHQAFDGLTYRKGALILAMLERWAGEEAFRDGIRTYLRDNAWGNAIAADLWKAVGDAAGRDIDGVALSFLDTPGVPEITVTPGKDGDVALRQAPYKLIGTEGPQAEGHRWKIPVRFAGGDWILFDAETGTVPAPGDGAVFHPNHEEWGYYRWVIPADRLRALAEGWRELDTRSLLGVFENAWAGVASGRMPPDAYLESLYMMREVSERSLVEELIAGVGRLDAIWEEELPRDGFARWARKLLAGHLDRIGMDPSEGEDEEERMLRPRLLYALGRYARDPGVNAHAEGLARRYLADPDAVPADLAPTALSLAALAGKLPFDTARVRYVEGATPDRRIAAIHALASMPPGDAAAKALDFSNADPFRAQDWRGVFGGLLGRAETREQAFAWFREHAAEVREHQPEFGFVHIGNLIGNFRTAEGRDAARAFLESLEIPGGERAIRQGTERADHAIALRAAGRDAVRRHLDGATASAS